LRILLIGDIVGKPGRRAVTTLLSKIKREYKIDLTIANGENVAGGVGITRQTAEQLFNEGIDVLTMGNHVWDKKEIYEFIDDTTRIVRPANYPPGTPGTGSTIIELSPHVQVGILNLAGRVFMPTLDCPFRTAEAIVAKLRQTTPIIIVDFHAEATSEKVALGWFLDGKVTAVVGTHTHIQTADARILPAGTAYLSDLGMTGPINSVIGVKKELVIQKMLTQLPTRFDVADGPAQFCGLVVEVDVKTGKATWLQRIWEECE